MVPAPISTAKPARVARKPLEAGTKRVYHLTTSEDLGTRVVSVHDAAGRLVWSKTRALTDTEIVETIWDSAHNPRWTLHRPLVGWYLTLRSPTLSPNSSIPLIPAPQLSAEHISFELLIRTLPDLEAEEREGLRSPNVRVDFVEEGEEGREEGEKSHFLLRTDGGEGAKGFGFGALRDLFTDRGKSFNCVWREENDVEVVRFVESVSMLSLATKGALELDEKLVDVLGMAPSFWVAVALAYLEFLEDREAYDAASRG